MPPFHVISGPLVRDVISRSRPEVVGVVQDAYLAHDEGRTVNPASVFLRFPDKPSARIIALPAFLGGDAAVGAPGGQGVAGIKWVASFPTNLERNLPRASAVLVLNDYETGYPFACLEASQINAARTAALAVVAAEELAGGRVADTIAVIGAGIIARNIVEFFAAQRWAVDRYLVHDVVPAYAAAMVDHIGGNASLAASSAEAIAQADVVVLATTAATPYLLEPGTFRPGQVVLNISLRDIGPEIIGSACNVLDDVDHCLTAGTSPHLAEQLYGHRGFVAGTLGQVMRRDLKLDDDKPRIFSPFGLGILDLAVGLHVQRAVAAQGLGLGIDDFFAEGERWHGLGTP
jgi:2,3-diaminopropionate biosynthesis protein SbnB